MKFRLALGVAGLALALATPALAELKFKPGEDARFNWANFEELKKVDLKGETLTVFGPWRGDDEKLVQSILDYFREATGADVKYSSSENYEQQIVIDTEAGSPPTSPSCRSLAFWPISLPRAASFRWPMRTPPSSTTTTAPAPAGCRLAPTRTRTAPRSSSLSLQGRREEPRLVCPRELRGRRLRDPKTMEDLSPSRTRSSPMAASLVHRLGSGGATGWPATDWVEDIMLRTQSPETYDKWVTNETKFDSAEVVGAIEEFGKFAKNDAWVDGGRGRCIDRFPRQPQGPLRHPAQVLHAPAGLVHPLLLPGGHEARRGCGLLLLPRLRVEARTRQTGSGRGTLVAITKDSKAARAFIDFLKLPLAHELWMAQSGFVTPHKGVNPRPTPMTR